MQDEETKPLVGVPAVMYTALWHVREMGFLKRMLDEQKIKRMSLYVHFDDYPPGGIITIDAEKGDYEVTTVEAGHGTGTVQCDCAVTGQLKPAIKLLEHDKNLLLGIIVLIMQRKIRVKGFFKLIKAAKFLLRCI